MKLHLIKSIPKPEPAQLSDTDMMAGLEQTATVMWRLVSNFDDYTLWHVTADAFKKMAYYRCKTYTDQDEICEIMRCLGILARNRKLMCPVPIKAKEEFELLAQPFAQKLDDLLSDFGF